MNVLLPLMIALEVKSASILWEAFFVSPMCGALPASPQTQPPVNVQVRKTLSGHRAAHCCFAHVDKLPSKFYFNNLLEEYNFSEIYKRTCSTGNLHLSDTYCLGQLQYIYCYRGCWLQVMCWSSWLWDHKLNS